jgi:hypothetical protein
MRLRLRLGDFRTINAALTDRGPAKHLRRSRTSTLVTYEALRYGC